MWIAVGAAVAIAVLWTVMARRQRKRQLDGREPRPVRDIARELAESAGIPEGVASRVLADLASALDIDASYLRPDDRFDGVLRAPTGWEYDDGLALALTEIQNRAQRSGVSPQPLETMADYARLSYRLQSSPPNEPLGARS